MDYICPVLAPKYINELPVTDMASSNFIYISQIPEGGVLWLKSHFKIRLHI
jgi:hypothetical protein